MKNKQPLVTVIVPIYNVEKYLEKCVNSILTQTYKNLEIILVDDGSTDGSGRIADDFGKKDKRIKVIHKENGGLSDARNTGLDFAKGEWIAFVDSDDYIEENFIEKLFEKAHKNDADIATCSFRSFTDDGSILKKTPKWPDTVFTGIEAIDDMMKNKRPAYIWLSIFRAKLFKDNNISFPVGHDYEDIATKIKLLYYSRRVSFLNENLYCYLIRGGSITGKALSERKYNDFKKALEDVEEFLVDKDNDFRFLEYFEFYSFFTLLNSLAKEEKSVYWREIRRELKRRIKNVVFPSIKEKMIYSLSLILSRNKKIYLAIYRKMKK